MNFLRTIPNQRLSRGLALAAWVLLGLSAVFFQADFAALMGPDTAISDSEFHWRALALQGQVTAGFWLMVVGGLALGAAIAYGRHAPAAEVAAPAAPAPTRWRYVLAGIGLLLVTAEVSGDLLGLPPIRAMHYHLQFVLFCAGIGLTVYGMSGGLRVSMLLPRWDRWEALSLLAILLLALAARFWQLQATIRVLVDELHFMAGILDFWQGGELGLMEPINTLSPFTRLYPYWQSWTVTFFGRGFLGLRAVSAILGTLNVGVVYALAKSLFDRRVALVAALLLATFPPHLHFSRLGIVQLGDMFFGTLALAFMARGLKSSSRADYVLAGAALGLTQYFYEGGRLLFPVMALAWAGWLMLARSSYIASLRRGLRRGMGALLLTAGIVAMPVYYTIIFGDTPLVGRLSASGLATDYWGGLLLSNLESGWLQEYLRHMADSFLVYVHMPERAFYYGGYHPFVLEPFVPFFLAGLWWLIWRGRALGGVLLLWLLFTSLGSGLLQQSAVASRFVVVYPALPLIMAVGLVYGLRLIWPPGSVPRWMRARATAFVLVCALIAGAQAVYYFAVHIPTFDVQFRAARAYRDIEDALIRAAEGLPPGTQVHLVMQDSFDPAYNRDLLRFLADGLTVETLHRDEVTADYIQELDRKLAHAFFIDPGDSDTLAIIQQRFVLAPPMMSPYADVPEDEQFALFTVVDVRRDAVIPEQSE